MCLAGGLWLLPAQAVDLQPFNPVGSPGGNPYRLVCPAGSYVVGFEGRAGGWLDHMTIVCARWLDVQRGFGMPVALNGRGIGDSTGGDPTSTVCPSGWGLAADHAVSFAREPPLLHSVLFSCKPFPDNGQVLPRTFGSSSPIATVAFKAVADQCPRGELPVGVHGRAGLFIDTLGFVCGPVPTIPPPVVGLPPVTGPVANLPGSVIVGPGTPKAPGNPQPPPVPQSFQVSCRGGGAMTATAGGDGFVRIAFAPAAQGSAAAQPRAGECAWSDRGFRLGEPLMLVYPASATGAGSLLQAADGGTFKVRAYNNNQGALVITKVDATDVATLPPSPPQFPVPVPPIVLPPGGGAPGPGLATVRSDVNVRAGATSSSRILGVLAAGTGVAIAACDANWCRLAQPFAGQVAWVSRPYLQF